MHLKTAEDRVSDWRIPADRRELLPIATVMELEGAIGHASAGNNATARISSARLENRDRVSLARRRAWRRQSTVAGGSIVVGTNGECRRQTAAGPQSPWLNTRPGVKFVGDAVCARCHADIAETFRHHPMGRSLFPIASAPAVGFTQPNGTATFGDARSEFTIERRGGREIHRETFRDGGQVLAQVEAEVAYAMGSGARAISYLVERDGRLFESPITWYTQTQKWDLSPGYERDNMHFERPIDPDCLYCHSNRVEPVPLSANRYNEPIFQGHAIGCERCHGPGELHGQPPGAFG